MYTHYNCEDNCAVVPNIIGAYTGTDVLFHTVKYSILFTEEQSAPFLSNNTFRIPRLLVSTELVGSIF